MIETIYDFELFLRERDPNARVHWTSKPLFGIGNCEYAMFLGVKICLTCPSKDKGHVLRFERDHHAPHMLYKPDVDASKFAKQIINEAYVDLAPTFGEWG